MKYWNPTVSITAVRLYKNNVSMKIIVNTLGVTKQAIYGWIRKSRKTGIKSLKSKKAMDGWMGPSPRLTEEQFKKLRKILNRPATRAGYSTDLWSGPRIGHLLRHTFKIAYHAKHLPRLFRRRGLYLKFPERRALEQDLKKVKDWKKNRLPEILEFTKKKRGLIFYADETVLSLIAYIGTTWTFPKATPIARVSGKTGQNIGVTAAVNPKGRLCFELTKNKERFTAKVFLRFVKKLRKENPNRFLALIVDGAPVHTAKIVKQFQRENISWFRMEILPAYSPELNPAEKPWLFVKTKKMNASTARNKVELRSNVKKTLLALKKDTQRVKSFF